MDIVDGWIDGCMDGWMERYTEQKLISSSFESNQVIFSRQLVHRTFLCLRKRSDVFEYLSSAGGRSRVQIKHTDHPTLSKPFIREC